MKTTIYELLGMIKDGKAPKKIWFNNNEWRLSGNDYYCDEEREYLFDIFVVTDIINDEVQVLETTTTYTPTYTIMDNKKYLVKYENGETLYEYIEDCNKIEKLNIEEIDMRCERLMYINGKPHTLSITELYMAKKINEIIDYFNKE